MKTKIIPTLLLLVVAILLNTSCGNKKEKSKTSTTVSDDKPLHPDVKTDFGQIGNYKTMDEYYIDSRGNKVWHGYRKNLYPSGAPKMVSYYEYDKLMWTEEYDEVGNVTSSNRK